MFDIDVDVDPDPDPELDKIFLANMTYLATVPNSGCQVPVLYIYSLALFFAFADSIIGGKDLTFLLWLQKLVT